MLTVTGPLVALLDRRGANHIRCAHFAKTLPAESMTTNWPCFTEAMYLLVAAGGTEFQRPLWDLGNTEALELIELSRDDCKQMARMMEQYHGVPMDLADASLIAVAERQGDRSHVPLQPLT